MIISETCQFVSAKWHKISLNLEILTWVFGSFFFVLKKRNRLKTTNPDNLRAKTEATEKSKSSLFKTTPSS